MATAAQVMVERCSKHPMEEKDIRCFDCKIDTCEICIQSEHSNHKWGSKSKLMKRQRAEVIRSFQNSENIISSFKMRMKDSKDTTEKQNMMFDTEMDKIKKKQASLVAKIESKGTELLNVCRERKNKRDMFFRHVSMTFSSLLQEYESLYSKYDEKKTTASDEEIIAYGQQLEDVVSRIESFSGDDLKSDIVEFIEGSSIIDSGQLFGRLRITSQNIKAIAKSAFTYGKGRISWIFPVPGDDALLRNHNAPCIKQVGSDGTEKTRHETSKTVSTFVLMEGCIIYTDYAHKTIGKLLSDGSSEVIARTPVGLTGICLDLENTEVFYVCICDTSTFSPSDFAERSITRMNLSGDTMEKIEYHQGKKMFNHPYRVCQNYNTNLCVIDRVNLDTGVVDVLQTNGELRFVYRGLNSPHPFNPCGVACDKTCRIFISDCKNHSVHVLNEDGNFLKYLLTKDTGIESPWSLAILGDILWVGNQKSLVKTYRLDDCSASLISGGP